MTKQTPSGQIASLFSSHGATAAALILVGGLAIAASGCDTVAQISFSQRGFNEIETSGFVPAGGGPDGSAGACEGVGNRMTMRFVMTDTSRRPIRLGDAVDGQSVELVREDVNFRDSAIFEVPQGETEVANVTGLREGPSCSSNDDCGYNGFQCGRSATIPDDAKFDACFTTSTFDVTSAGASQKVRFVSDLETSKVLGIAVEVSSSTVGAFPTLRGTDYNPGQGQQQVFWDQDNDGMGDIAVTPESPGPESDEDQNRISAIGPFQTAAITTQRLLADEGRAMAVGAWTFSSLPEAERPLEERIWATSTTNIVGLLTQYRNTLDPQLADVAETYANTYELVAQLIRDNYTDETIGAAPGGDRMLAQGVEKTLVLVVDGPDDTGSQVDDLIAAAQEQDVRVFVVQYDPAYTEDDVAQLYTPPQYVANQETCSDASDCRNFETCRSYKGFSSNQGESTVGVDPSESFCLPHRDADGRFGPIADFQRLACETGGGYMYIRSASALAETVGWLPYTTEGLWEADVSSNNIGADLSDQDTGTELLLQTLVDINIGGTNKVYQFSQVGGRASGQADSTVAATDTRAAVVTPAP